MPRQLSRLFPLLASACLLGLATRADAQQAPFPQQQAMPPQQLAPLPQSGPGGPSSVVVLPPGQGVVLQTSPPPGAVPNQAQPQIIYVQQDRQAAPMPMVAAPSLGPMTITDWDESRPITPGYHVVKKTRVDLIAAGASLFGAFYLLSAFDAAAEQDANSPNANPAAGMWVPGFGPFIYMTQTGSATANFFLAIDGLAQLTGLTLFTIGIASPQTVLRRNDLGFDLHLEPMVGPGRQGMSFVGRF